MYLSIIVFEFFKVYKSIRINKLDFLYLLDFNYFSYLIFLIIRNLNS